MIRRLLAMALPIALAIPVSAQAQPAQPLRTFCTSITTDYCMSVLSYETFVTATDGGRVVRAEAEILLFGRSYRPNIGSNVQVSAIAYLDCQDNYLDLTGTQLPVRGVIGDTNGQPCTMTPDPARVRAPSPDDFTRIVINQGSSGAGVCTIGDTCVEVPEPGAYMLLLGGLIGLAGVGYRRRGEQLG